MELSKLLSELEKLNLPKGEYAIFGSGPPSAREIREARDLDILASKKLYEKLILKYNAENEKIVIGNIEIFMNVRYVDNPEDVIRNAEMIHGYPFARLEDILEWKKKMGRGKDIRDIELIKRYVTR